ARIMTAIRCGRVRHRRTKPAPAGTGANPRSRASAGRPRTRTAARTPPPCGTHGADRANVKHQEELPAAADVADFDVRGAAADRAAADARARAGGLPAAC